MILTVEYVGKAIGTVCSEVPPMPGDIITFKWDIYKVTERKYYNGCGPVIAVVRIGEYSERRDKQELEEDDEAGREHTRRI